MTDAVGTDDRPRLPSRRRLDPAFSEQAERIDLLGMPVDVVDAGETVDRLYDAITRGRGGQLVTPNLDHLRRYVQEPAVRPYIDEAALVVADGMPLVWASRLQGTPLPERVAGSDLIFELVRVAAEQGRSVFLLGGEPGVAEDARRRLVEDVPGLDVVGTHCPPFGFEDDEREMARVVEALVDARPDVVLVGLPFPKPEKIRLAVGDRLPATWFAGLGVSLSFVTGDVSRAPAWMQRTGLEWVYRLTREPKRLFRRYLVEGLPFGLRLGLSASRRGARRRRGDAASSRPGIPA